MGEFITIPGSIVPLEEAKQMLAHAKEKWPQVSYWLEPA